MKADPPTSADTQEFATRAILWLQLIALAVGALQFAFAPAMVERPLLAAGALALLTASTLLGRTVRALQHPLLRQHRFELAALVACVTLLAGATGAAHSPLVMLYLLPLAGTALAFGSVWPVLLLAVLVAALGFLLGALTPDLVVSSPAFAVQLFTVLAPATVVALALAALTHLMSRATRQIDDLAATDALTGLLNLRSFEKALQQEHRKAERFARTYSILIVDVDDLTQVNETLGHEAGSEVLGAVAAALVRSIRSSDVAARLGGDEFVILLVEANAAIGVSIAHRIRHNVHSSSVSVAHRIVRADVNVGIASFPEDHLYPKELMILAEQRMQQDRELRRPPAA